VRHREGRKKKKEEDRTAGSVAQGIKKKGRPGKNLRAAVRVNKEKALAKSVSYPTRERGSKKGDKGKTATREREIRRSRKTGT